MSNFEDNNYFSSAEDRRFYSCAKCKGTGWIAAGEDLDEIDRVLVGIVGKDSVKKMCKVCHGSGVMRRGIGGSELA